MSAGRGSLVGRDRELSELRRGLVDVRAGRGRLFMVAGDPGAGKTALADAIGAEASASGATVLWGRAWDGGGAPSYWPWLRILRRLAAMRDLRDALAALGPEATRRLARLVPALGPAAQSVAVATASAPTAPATHSGESGAARFALFDAITSLLRAAAAQGPLVLVLDDLHAADHPSLLLLDFLAVHVRDSPILVLGTYREVEARHDPQLAAKLGDIIRHGRRLPLRGLRERDVAEVVEQVAARRAPEPVVRAIHQATEGNPFFVDELVRLLSAEGRLDDAAQVAGARIPDGVRETIRHRLDPLPDSTRRLLCTAAVIGREFRIDTLQRVSGAEPAQLDEALGEAVGTGIVAERAGTLGAYAFSHGLIREAVYDDLGPHRRGRLHREVGLVLEDLYAADPEPRVAELAHHFFAAAATGEPTRAIEYSVRAGERAMRLVAYEEAAEHFARALHVYGLQRQADAPRRCDLLLALGAAQSRAGDSRAARETFLRAAGLARRLGAPERLAKAALGYGAGMGGFELGRVDEGLVALLDEAREALGDEDGPLRARVLGRQATELYFSDRVQERAALADQAVAIARRCGDRAALASTLSARLLALWGPENGLQRLQAASDVVGLAEEAGDRELVLRGHVWRIVSLMELGDWVGADIALAFHARLAEELRDPLHLWYVPLFGATRALLEGRHADAERFAGDAFAAGRRAQAQNAAQLYAMQLFALRAEQGRLAEVEQSLAQLGRRYPAAAVWRAASAFALSALGRTDDARRAFEAMTGDRAAELPRDGEWLSTVALLIRTGAQLGDAGRTGELGELLAPYMHGAVIAGRGAVCLGPVSRFAGIAAAAAGRRAEAIGLLEHALAVARRWGAEPMIAAIGLELAELLERPDSGPGSGSGSAGDEPRAGTALGALAFYRRGDIWTIGAPAAQIQMRHAKGLEHVARLLAAPRVEFHALDLVDVRPRGGGDPMPALDDAAKAAYRARLAELHAEIEEAESFSDPERAGRAREELAFVTRELAAAAGGHGRDRKTRTDAERARLNVTRAIRTALKRLSEHDPVLGRRLGAAIRTGTFCVYDPPPGDEPVWDLKGPA
ncbi:MAG: ATP-binding protein [Thermoleophilia bacterium]